MKCKHCENIAAVYAITTDKNVVPLCPDCMHMAPWSLPSVRYAPTDALEDER